MRVAGRVGMEPLQARGMGVEGGRVGSVFLGTLGSVLLWGSDGYIVGVGWVEGKRR